MATVAPSERQVRGASRAMGGRLQSPLPRAASPRCSSWSRSTCSSATRSSTDAELTAPGLEAGSRPTCSWANITGCSTTRGPDGAQPVQLAVVAVLQTVGHAADLPALAGYGLARIPYRCANKVFYAVTATLMIPAAVTFVPSFVLVSTPGLDLHAARSDHPGPVQAFATFLFRQYFLGFPKELEEAARIDGLGYWGTFWRIVVPNSLRLLRRDRHDHLHRLAGTPSCGRWSSARTRSRWTVQIALSTFLTAQTVRLQPAVHGRRWWRSCRCC